MLRREEEQGGDGGGTWAGRTSTALMENEQ